MAELPLEGWTAAQREGLAFLLDDAAIEADWGANSVSVPDGDQDRAQRFVDFLSATGNQPIGEDHERDAEWSRWTADHELTDAFLFNDDPGSDAVATPGLRLGGALVNGLAVCLAVGWLALLGRAGVSTELVLVALYDVLSVGLAGRNLGNVAVRTRVVSLHGHEIPGLRAGFIRWLVPSIPWLVSFAVPWFAWVSWVWVIAVYLPILIGPGHRGLHDRAAGVIVLDDRLTRVTPRPDPSRTPTDDVPN